MKTTTPTPPLPQKGEGVKVSDDTRRLAACVERLSKVFTLEQLEQVSELLLHTYDLAVLRECEQSVTVVFNDKGLPRWLNASNNVRVVKPKLYHAE